MHTRAPAAVALAACLALGCSDDPLTTTPPAAVDPTGVWSGTWTEDVALDPASGAVTFSFLGDLTGEVEGTSSFGGLACLTTHPFAGTVAAFAMDGTSMEEGILVSFDFDLRGVDDEVPTIVGEFRVDLGEECAGLRAEFQLALQVVPGTPEPLLAEAPAERPVLARDGARSAPGRRDRRQLEISQVDESGPMPALLLPGLDVTGDWLGDWRADRGDCASKSIALSFLQTQDGAVLGIVALDGATPHAFAGRVSGALLAGIAAEGGSWIELGAQGDARDWGAREQLVGHLIGHLVLKEGASSDPSSGLFRAQRVPRPSAESSSSNTIGAFAGR